MAETAGRAKAKGYNGNGCGTPLAMAAKLWPTPNAMDGMAPRSQDALREAQTKGGCSNLKDMVSAPLLIPDIRDISTGGTSTELISSQGDFLASLSVTPGSAGARKMTVTSGLKCSALLKEARPAWVLGENVAGFVAMELDRCISDLESIGYAVWPLLIPACAVGAFHRRTRAGSSPDETTSLARHQRDGTGRTASARDARACRNARGQAVPVADSGTMRTRRHGIGTLPELTCAMGA